MEQQKLQILHIKLTYHNLIEVCLDLLYCNTLNYSYPLNNTKYHPIYSVVGNDPSPLVILNEYLDMEQFGKDKENKSQFFQFKG